MEVGKEGGKERHRVKKLLVRGDNWSVKCGPAGWGVTMGCATRQSIVPKQKPKGQTEN